MAIQWGSWSNAGDNGMRVGIDVSRTSVSHSSSNVRFTIRVYTQNLYQYLDPQTLHMSGALSTTHAFNNNSSGGAVLRATYSFTHTYSGYGSGTSYPLSASVSGTYNGSAPSVNVTLVVPPRPIAGPTAPTGVSAELLTIGENRFRITWNRTATSGRPWSSVTIFRRTFFDSWETSSGGGNTLSGLATSYTDPNPSGRPGNLVYQFGVRSNNAKGSSAIVWSNAVFTRPAAPSNVTSRVLSDGSVRTTWTDRAYRTTTTPVVHQIMRSNDGGATWVSIPGGSSISGSSFTDTSPNAGSNRYRVRSYMSVGSLASSYVVGNLVTTIVPPLAPAALSPNGANVDLNNDLTLTWRHVDGGDGSEQSVYSIQYSGDGGSTWNGLAADVASDVSEHVIPGGTLTNGVTYLWRVCTRGVSTYPYGPWSPAASFSGSTTPVVTIDSPSGIVTALPIVATWTYQQDEASPQAEFVAMLRDAAGNILETRSGTTGTSAEFAYSAEDAEHLTVTVRVRSAAGLWSEIASSDIEISLPSPGSASMSGSYDECLGIVQLQITADSLLPAPADLENLITNPSMVTPGALTALYRNLIPNPGLTGDGAVGWSIGANISASTLSAPWAETYSALRLTIQNAFAAGPVLLESQQVALTGGAVSGTFKVLGSSLASPDFIGVELAAYDSGSALLDVIDLGQQGIIPQPSTFTFAGTPLPTGTATVALRLIATENMALGATLDVADVGLYASSNFNRFFYGGTDDTDTYVYEWEGTEGASVSSMSAYAVADFSVLNSKLVRTPAPPKMNDGEDIAEDYAGLFMATRQPNSAPGLGAVVLGSANGAWGVDLDLGVTYTAMVRVLREEDGPPLRLRWEEGANSSEVETTAGELDEVLRLTFTPTASSGLLFLVHDGFLGDPNVWIDEVLLVEDFYTGPYFDGSTRRTSTKVFSWTGEPNESTSLMIGRAEISIDSVAVQRRTNGGPWVTLVTGMQLPGSFIDLLPITNGLNEYRLIVASSLPAYRTLLPVQVYGTDGERGSGLWTFLAYGPGFNNILRCRGDIQTGQTSGRVKGFQHVSGRQWPIHLSGTNSEHVVNVSAKLRYDADCIDPDPGDCTFDSPAWDWEEASHTQDIVCLRDHRGRRLFGLLSDVTLNDEEPGMSTLSFSVTRMDYTENYGTPDIPDDDLVDTETPGEDEGEEEEGPEV